MNLLVIYLLFHGLAGIISYGQWMGFVKTYFRPLFGIDCLDVFIGLLLFILGPLSLLLTVLGALVCRKRLNLFKLSWNMTTRPSSL